MRFWRDLFRRAKDGVRQGNTLKDGGEFTRLSQIYGNHIIFLGTDGDEQWENKNTRFLKPFTQTRS